MRLPPTIEAIRRHPGMFVVPATLDNIVTLLNGYDLALSGGFLVGFREWLIVRIGQRSNLAWDGLVMNILETNRANVDEARSIEGLFALLEEFLDIRQAHDGLRRIFVQYEHWLHQQEWYTPTSPDWFDPAKPAKLGRPRKKGRRVSS